MLRGIRVDGESLGLGVGETLRGLQTRFIEVAYGSDLRRSLR
jgi:hypothetical protein